MSPETLVGILAYFLPFDVYFVLRLVVLLTLVDKRQLTGRDTVWCYQRFGVLVTAPIWPAA